MNQSLSSVTLRSSKYEIVVKSGGGGGGGC